MVKATKRKRPAARKKTAPKGSRWALSGWVVAAGVGLAWATPHFSGSLPNLPSLSDLPDQVASLIESDDARPAPAVDDRTVRVAPKPAAPIATGTIPKRSAEPDAVREGRIDAGAAATSSERKFAAVPKASVVIPTAVPPSRDQRQAAPRKPLLPDLSPDISSAVASKAQPKPVVPLKKPMSPDAPRSAAPTPPMAVPGPDGSRSSPPLMASAIHKETSRPPSMGRPGELAIRRYPFTTAPTVAFVGDLRKVRIIGGQGDWKKVEVATSGQTGWLRLQRFEP